MTEFDLALTLECIKSVEVLMTSPNLEISTENSCQGNSLIKRSLEEKEQADSRVDKLLMFLIPVLISHLIVQGENNDRNSCWKEKLNEVSLKKITEIGQRWPLEFRKVFFRL